VDDVNATIAKITEQSKVFVSVVSNLQTKDVFDIGKIEKTIFEGIKENK